MPDIHICGALAYELNVQQYCCGGLNFGYFYDKSPIIAYDGAEPPPYSMGEFTSSTVPGCRLPHFWLPDGSSLYGTLGAGYTLLRFYPQIHVDGLAAAANDRSVPLDLPDIEPGTAPEAHKEGLVLARPDQHVAWRGNAPPVYPLDLVDLIRGARVGATDCIDRRSLRVPLPGGAAWRLFCRE